MSSPKTNNIGKKVEQEENNALRTHASLSRSMNFRSEKVMKEGGGAREALGPVEKVSSGADPLDEGSEDKAEGFLSDAGKPVLQGT